MITVPPRDPNVAYKILTMCCVAAIAWDAAAAMAELLPAATLPIEKKSIHLKRFIYLYDKGS